MSVPKDTAKWIRSKADEVAVANGCTFDEHAAAKVCEFFPRFLRHSKGEWYGKPFELLDWQREDIIYPLFGWKRPDGTRRFRKAFIFLPKKNGKSTLAAGIGLYLLTADGEPGAEVYSAATDQKQAGIVHGEAISMRNASPELTRALQVNNTTKAITYIKNGSVYRALSSEARGSEGLNAHGIIADELHVWYGRELWDSLKYAFRSRRQGLLFVITTAGSDPLSVAYEQYSYAKSVLAGDVTDDRFFAYIREADAKDDWKDPATWRKANPSFGITVQAADFEADVKEAEASPTQQASFKRYSLNIWQSSTNPWLDMGCWEACRRSFTEESMLAELDQWSRWGALDLSKTEDMTSFVLVFRHREHRDRYRLLPYFWLPQGSVDDTSKPEHYRVWAKSRALRTMPGDVCDYSFVRERIVSLHEKFGPFQYAYDPFYAQETEQRLKEDHDIEGVKFLQTMSNFAGPTGEFERLVIAGTMEHNSHPILDWQARNVSVYQDANGNKRPVKPKQGDNRKIDGIVAGIMGVGLAITGDDAESIYDKRARAGESVLRTI